MPDSTRETSRLMILMFTDLVGSVALKGKWGAVAYARAIARHDELFRGVVDRFSEARVLQDTGDGFFASFRTIHDAVNAALLFQHGLAIEPWPGGPLRVRIGINVGQVVVLEGDRGEDLKFVGLASDLTARVMSLAEGSQILMTRTVFDEARQFVAVHPGEPGGTSLELKWVAHGPYRFKGTDEPAEVFEVGAVGVAPFSAPPDSEKAKRFVSDEEIALLGWRPAPGLAIPDRKGWFLERRLGQGGFGEVWLGRNSRLGRARAFKFCFNAERLKSLKRELTLFRLLRTALGDRDDISRLHEVQIEHFPFFLESDYSESGNLDDWAAGQGGMAAVPLVRRLDLVARIAGATAAAHSVGVLHKDIKPSNVLIYEDVDGVPRPRLSDFGIGVLADRTRLQQLAITETGFNTTSIGDSTEGTTRMYTPPEVLAGRPFTVQGDVYALGVLLYQCVVGDLSIPLAPGWERNIPDPLLRDDLAACVDGDPAKRLATAAALAQRLGELDARRARAARAAARARRRRAWRWAAALSPVLVLVAVLLTLSWIREQNLRAERTRREGETTKARAFATFVNDLIQSADPDKARGAKITVREVLDGAAPRVDRDFAEQPEVCAALHYTIGKTYENLFLNQKAERHFRRALQLQRQLHPEPHPAVADALHALSRNLTREGGLRSLREAAKYLREAIDIRRKTLGEHHLDTLEARGDLANINGAMSPDGNVDQMLATVSDFTRGKLTKEQVRQQLTDAVARGAALFRAGDTAAGIAAVRKVIDPHLDVPGAREVIPSGLGILAHRQVGLNDLAGAEIVMRTALAYSEESKGLKHPERALLLNGLAVVRLEGQSGLDETQRILDEALAISVPMAGEDHICTVLIALHRAKVLQLRGLSAEAREQCKQAAIWAAACDDPMAALFAAYTDVDLMIRRGEYVDAERAGFALLGKSKESSAEDFDREDINAADVRRLLVRLYEAWGKPELAAPYRPPASHPTAAAAAPATREFFPQTAAAAH